MLEILSFDGRTAYAPRKKIESNLSLRAKKSIRTDEYPTIFSQY